MHPANRFPSFRQAGFTLMELMVGMTIGMIATIVIVQVMTVFEAQKRSTTGTADAQTNGGIALYMIARELQAAGYPLFPGTDTALSCTTTTSSVAGVTQITPVTITEVAEVAGASGSPATDSIIIRYGTTTTTGANAGAAPGVQMQVSATDVPNRIANVGSSLGCQIGNLTMINTGVTCHISQVDATWDLSPITVKLANTTGLAAQANLACLGTWNEVTYAVNAATGNLERTVRVNGVASAAVPSVVGIVNIRAQYGISAAGNSNQVTSWVDANAAPWITPTVADRNRIKAIRIAVVARNAKKEQTDVSALCSSTTAANPTGLCMWDGSTFAAPGIVDLSPGNPDWKKYRYRVFETIVPLRNVIWSKDTL